MFESLYRWTDRLQPVLIGGCGRSGTTLLLSMLSAHPSIVAIPFETEAFCPGAYSGAVDLGAPFCLDVVEDYLASIPIPHYCSLWCEKTPKNVVFLGPILAHFGLRMRFLNIVRDGRDVITSKHPNRRQDHYWVSPERWIHDVGAGSRFDDHPQVMVLRYEDLVLKCHDTLKEVCDFIGIPFAEEIKNWYRHAKVRRHGAWSGLVRHEDTGSVGRWQDRKHRERVEDLMGRAEALALLRHYGYLKET